MQSDSQRTFIFTIARMNPPTPGHLEIVKHLIQHAVTVDESNVYVILSKTLDSSNPLPCDKNTMDITDIDKKTVLDALVRKLKEDMIATERSEERKSQIQRINVIAKCVQQDQYSPFDPMLQIVNDMSLQKTPFTLHAVLGEDRRQMIQSIDKLMKKRDNADSIKFDAMLLMRTDMEKYKGLTKEELLELDVSELSPGMMSASFIRNLVKYDCKELFTRIYEPYLSTSMTNILYNTIQQRLTVNKRSPVKPGKASSKSKPSKAISRKRSRTPSPTGKKTVSKQRAKTARKTKLDEI